MHAGTRRPMQQNLDKGWSRTMLCETVNMGVLTWPLRESSRQSRRLGR